MKTRKLIVLVLALILVGSASTVHAKTKLTALSGLSAEVHILTEAVKILLEKNLDVEIEHIPHFTGDLLMHNAMVAGDSDIYVSYTGTQFTGVLGMEVTDEWKDRDKILAYVREQFDDQFGITWLDPFGFNNTYAIVVKREFAKEHNLKTMSDLHGLSQDMILGMDAVYRDRQGDGYDAMNAAYDFTWKRPASMDYGLIYRSVASGDVDAAVAYSTDGRIPAMDLVILEDDLQFFPPYDCCVVVTNEILKQFPEIPEILSPLIGAIDEETIAYYNQLVLVEYMEFEDVAQMLVDDLVNKED